LERIEPLLDGRQIDCSALEISTSGDGWTLAWSFGPATDPARPRPVLVLRITRLLPERGLLLDVALESADPDVRLQSIGLRIGKTDGVLRYLRNGYTSWDGSYFVEPDEARGDSRFHELTDTEVHSLALFAALTGGLLMTSDQLDEVCTERRHLFAQLAGDGKVRTCSFPQLGQGDPVLVQQVLQSDGSVLINMFNTGDTAADRVVPGDAARAMRVSLAAHEARLLTFRP
jgi:hypothetical protein